MAEDKDKKTKGANNHKDYREAMSYPSPFILVIASFIIYFLSN
jgi:hypothetical protein